MQIVGSVENTVLYKAEPTLVISQNRYMHNIQCNASKCRCLLAAHTIMHQPGRGLLVNELYCYSAIHTLVVCGGVQYVEQENARCRCGTSCVQCQR